MCNRTSGRILNVLTPMEVLMHRSISSVLTLAVLLTAGDSPLRADANQKNWVQRSNQYTQRLLDVQLRYSPEGGSAEGIAKYDTQISDPTRTAEVKERAELQAVLADVRKAEANETDPQVR